LFIKDLMRISVLGPVPYEDVVNMTPKERKILSDVLQERADAQNPNKKTQQLEPGVVSGPVRNL